MITKKDVEYIAHLSRLEITEEEKEEYTKQLSKILEHMEKLKKLNTENVKPTYYVTDIKNVFRKDVVKKSIDKEKVFKSAPAVENNGFKVPRII